MINEAIWDYKNPYIWMEKARKSEFPPLMISAALTGGIHGKECNINLPETIDEQVEAAYQAYQAGAVAVHLHVRDPKNITKGSKNPDDFSKVNERIRKRCPGMIINNSTGGTGELTLEEKMAGLFAECKPDVASLNPGPFMLNLKLNARPAPLSFPREECVVEGVIPIKYSDVYKTAKVMKEKGIRAEIEIFHSGHFWVVNDLIEKELLEKPFSLQFIFGFQTSVQPNPWCMLSMINEMPKGSVFFCPGVGPYQLPMNVMSILMGGHVRIGLEDNVYYRKGELAKSSAQQIERIRRISEEMGRPVASCKEAREMLGLAQI